MFNLTNDHTLQMKISKYIFYYYIAKYFFKLMILNSGKGVERECLFRWLVEMDKNHSENQSYSTYQDSKKLLL